MAPRDALNAFPLTVHVPWLTEAVAKVKPAGNVSAMVTAFAVLGPRFVTVSVKVALLERFSAAGETDSLKAKSAMLPEQHTTLLIPTESMYQPALAVLLSVPLDQRS